MKLSVIVGLMGSGKSFLGNTMPPFYDDFGTNYTLDFLKTLTTATIACPLLCIEENRNKIINSTNLPIDWIFYENNPEQCWINVQNRNDKRIISKDTIFQLSKVYTIPKDIKPLKVYNSTLK